MQDESIQFVLSGILGIIGMLLAILAMFLNSLEPDELYDVKQEIHECRLSGGTPQLIKDKIVCEGEK